MESKRKKVVVVLGMHRSGTSAITRGLHVLGTTLGERLIPAILGDNDKGFWEDSDINNLNQVILKKLGSVWHNTKIINKSELLNQNLDPEKDKALKIFSEKIKNTAIFGYKDPRTAILLPFWQEVFKRLNLNDCYVISLRNPISVAESLFRRDGIAREKSFLLWSNHTISAVRHSKGKPRVVVEYDRLLDFPTAQLERISEALELHTPFEQQEELDEYLENFISIDLRHHVFDLSYLESSSDVLPFTKAIYRWLLKLARDEIDFDNPSFVQAWRNIETEFLKLSSLYSYLDRLELEQEDALLAAREATKERDSAITERDETINGLTVQLAERDETINGLTVQLVERDETLTLIKDELDHTYNSKSWKLTGPLRAVRRIFSMIYLLTRQYTSNTARAIWYSLPFSVKSKLAFKSSIFKIFPLLFKHTVAYQVWQTDEPYYELHHGTASFDKDEQINPVPLLDADPLENVPVRLIAFYLPQFHPIPENDEWWGEGFTEWTNVKPATPQFVGHYQPHVPGELGYYDLRSKEVQRRQVELAKLYGISGFCFYLYWFGGKRLLELPVQNYLENQGLDLPFCLCWANENWSRRWDGLDNEILIKQNHSIEDDLAFIEHVSIYLKDSRYIRIKGKPLLLVYQPALFPSIRKTVKRWRNWCRENDIGEIYLAYTQSFEAVNPKKYDFDGAIEFPPNNTAPPAITDRIKPLSPEFSGIVYDWNIFVERSRKYKKSDYPLFRGVCSSWDNTARRMENAGIFLGSTPEKYSEWLENASVDTVRRFSDPSERLVFVNAWNEWAEGAYLEPDQRYGYAYLQATRDALEHINNRPWKRRIVLVAHDAHPHGAQINILYMAKVLNEDFKFTVDMVVLGGGALLKKYARYATIHKLPGNDTNGAKAKSLAATLFAEGARSVIANTAVTGNFVEVLKIQGFRVVSLIHELPGVIKKHRLQSHVKSIAEHADWVVFPAKKVKEGFDNFSRVPSERTVIRPQGLYKKNFLKNSEQVAKARKDLRHKFKLPETARIVLCVGYADHRKGIDLFVEIGLKVLRNNSDVYFLWVGHFDSGIKPRIKKMIEGSDYFEHFIFPGLDLQSDIYFAGSDIYALTSREDPFPSVVMEALDVCIPVVAFDDTGGFTELLSRGGGRLVPAFDTTAYARTLVELMYSPDNARRLAQSGKMIVENELSYRRYTFDLLALAKAPLKRVSVIVPNYNYAEYLVERITSIVHQDYPIYEIIILDDASSDDSVRVLNNLISTINIDCRFIINDSNSGNPFVQWLKGVELARGDYIWIAEADDLSEPGFLKEVLLPFKDPSIVMSYCQSKQMDLKGKILSDNYLDYVSDISSDKWLTHYVEEGLTEVRSSLAIKNVIPNVSAVVFERNSLLKALKEGIEEIKEYRVAGDWITYIYALSHGKIAFLPKSLNLHRRHQNSVTISNFNLSQLEEILAVQKKVRDSFSLNEEVVSKAQAYSQRLYKEFNLATHDAPILSKHPRLAAYLED